VAGNPELANQEHVEGDAQGGGDLVRHRHPTAGQPKDDDIGASAIVLQEPGQDPTGLSSIPKQTISHPHPLPNRRNLGYLNPGPTTTVSGPVRHGGAD
jgi:hypothetical protein